MFWWSLLGLLSWSARGRAWSSWSPCGGGGGGGGGGCPSRPGGPGGPGGPAVPVVVVVVAVMAFVELYKYYRLGCYSGRILVLVKFHHTRGIPVPSEVYSMGAPRISPGTTPEGVRR